MSFQTSSMQAAEADISGIVSHTYFGAFKGNRSSLTSCGDYGK